MKRYSWSFLIPATLFFLALFFAFIYWQVHIVRVTFLRTQILNAVLLTALLVALPAAYGLIRRMRGNGDNVWMRLKRIAASIGVSLFLTTATLYFVVSVLAWAVPGEESYYSATFTYVGGGRNDCSGAEVYDPDLQKEVRVCHPIGDYYDEGTLVVHKRTNTLGAVMMDGRVLP